MKIYFLLLVIMILLLYEGIICSLYYVPRKIKIISFVALILMTIRYITLIILLIVKDQNHLYMLKPLVYTNFLCIPICGIISVFIFVRKNTIKLRKIILISGVLCLGYCIVIYNSSANTAISNLYGYTIKLQLENYFYYTSLIINSILIIMGINLFNTRYSNKLGSLLIVISASITLISVLLTTINTSFNFLLLGDISWILTMDYALNKVKRHI
ncbi:hypothetical protein [Clostridium estertheticum]|uniref:Histidine kinase N-terminal 7TM region domain-containing protein n=1 Tax=Clostridium estertheticum subsp. estertheticum TaxID=1552 RepID=A0A1J0GLC7_9CLOT|nr:hypothetical protein [Clostridium estertheticum]APC42095.1 hypothetical protein A7L45_19565 [Clostridium estertheticum subsp. estertheticum]MBU3073824.1 hypothetical protein [Clostridium estertheticum]MBU3163917.1 hypothetical protein [Clostridium estertheticum]MBZ9615992.1 hypothetical protein [Clostridium estertheticum subsp. laramiense]WAG75860.1 hypothetical protein LL032_10985 [Clostridium estertheticum]